MFPVVHEAGWRIVLFYLLTAIVSLGSLISLLKQGQQSRHRRLQNEITRQLEEERGTESLNMLPGDDPVDILNPLASRFKAQMPRYLMMSAHSLVFIVSLLFLVPALKSARYTHLGNNAYSEHNYEGAVKAYEVAISSNGCTAFLHKQMLDSLAQRDDKSGDLGEMRRMVGLHPGNQAGHNDLGNALMQKGDTSTAIGEYRQAVVLNPNDPIAHNNLGNALKTANQFVEAIAEFHRALELAPNQIPTYYNLANALQSSNQIEEAIKYYRIAIDKNPKLAPVYYNLAEALKKQGKRDEAIATMDTFIQLASPQPAFGAVVALAQKKLADWRKAP